MRPGGRWCKVLSLHCPEVSLLLFLPAVEMKFSHCLEEGEHRVFSLLFETVQTVGGALEKNSVPALECRNFSCNEMLMGAV